MSANVAEIPPLSEIAELAFAALAEAVDRPENPFRTAVFSTAHAGNPAGRTVVLRGVDAGSRCLWSFSDVRADKIAALRVNPVAAWCFYDPTRRFQLRMEGPTEVHVGTGFAQQMWDQLAAAQRQGYGLAAEPGTILSESWEIQWMERPFDYFAVVTTTVEYLDWLELVTPMHRRATANWNGIKWLSHWVAP